MGTGASPMTLEVSTSKVRICQDLFNAVSGRGIYEDTDTSAVPACKIEHVLRDIIWRILYLCGVAVVDAAEKWLRDPTVSPGWRPLCSAVFSCSRRIEYLSVTRVEMTGGFLSRVWFGVVCRFHGRHSGAPSQTSVF